MCGVAESAGCGTRWPMAGFRGGIRCWFCSESVWFLLFVCVFVGFVLCVRIMCFEIIKSGVDFF